MYFMRDYVTKMTPDHKGMIRVEEGLRFYQQQAECKKKRCNNKLKEIENKKHTIFATRIFAFNYFKQCNMVMIIFYKM